jgi:hypothetical protein
MSQPATRTRLAAVPVGPGAGEVVRGRLGHAERQDVGQRGGVVVQPELAVGEQRQDGAFLAEHAADQCVDGDQQGELGRVAP